MDRRPPRALGEQRLLALIGSLMFLAFTLGCMSVNIGGRTEIAPPADSQVQRGTVTVPANQTVDVFYPNPYVSTPNLVVENSWNDFRIEEQRPGHFRVHNPGPFAREITWKARGEKVPTEVLMQGAKAGLGTPAESITSSK